ncbi:MAG: flagellar hook-associated protein FlgL [bacterium]
MLRVSNRTLSDTVMANLTRNLQTMEKLHYQLSSGKRVRVSSDDPIATLESMRMKSLISQSDQYERNIDDGEIWVNTTDRVLDDMGNMFHRLKSLTVQGASDVLAQNDRDDIALEINQILEEAVRLSNTNFSGRYIFSGTLTQTPSFVSYQGKDTGQNSNLTHINGAIRTGINQENITQVNYQGNKEAIYREIGVQAKVQINVAGDDIFAATTHRITMGSSVANPAAVLGVGPGVMRINGKEIFYENTSSLNDIRDKINNAKTGITASVIQDGPNYRLSLLSDQPAEIWMEDVNGGTLLSNTLQLTDSAKSPPNNIHSNATTERIDLFQAIINIRNDLYRGDGARLSSTDLENLDATLNNFLAWRAQQGAKGNRLEMAMAYNEDTLIYAKDLESKAEGVDLAKTIMELKIQETAQQSALASGARLIQPSLLDYLR